MTLHHIFYIPTVFLLGFVFGTMVNAKPRIKVSSGGNNVLNNEMQYKTSLKRLLQTLVIFILVFIITHVFDIPGGVKSVIRLLGGIEIFDKSPVFSSTEVYERIMSFSSEGLTAYRRFTYTTDVLFPLSFLGFLWTLSTFVSQRIVISKTFKIALNSLPFVWFFSDLLENASILYILSKYPNEVSFLGSSLGIVTVVKFTLLFLSMFSPVLLIIIAKKRIEKSK